MRRATREKFDMIRRWLVLALLLAAWWFYGTSAREGFERLVSSVESGAEGVSDAAATMGEAFDRLGGR